MPDQKPFLCKCLDALYDEEEGMLVLNCLLEEYGEQRLIVMNRDNFHFKDPGRPVPIKEMHRTADLFKGKRFRLVVEDDPNRSKPSGDDLPNLAGRFKDRIVKELDQVADGMIDPQRQIDRRVQQVIEREQERSS
jgi:hypothetical protein